MKLLTSWQPLEIDRELVKEAREKTGKIILRGILQKAEAVNQNGRIYPREIIEREVRNYQKFIVENRALGECVPAGTEILTPDGYRPIEDVQEGDIVMTLNLDTNELVEEPVLDKIDNPFKGNLLHFSSRTSDMVVTPGHKIVLWDRSGKPYKMIAEDLQRRLGENDSYVNHSGIRRSGMIWKGTDTTATNPPGLSKTLDPEAWAAFLGIYIAEGHSSGTKKIENAERKAVIISQKKEETKTEIRELLTKLPWNFVERNTGFEIQDEELHTHLFQLGSSYYKHIPRYAMEWNPKLLNVLFDWMLKGDGKNRTNRGKFVRELSTTSPQLAADVTELLFKIGKSGSIHTYLPKDRMIEEDRMILAENSKPIHIIYEHTSNNICASQLSCEPVPYEGRVYCVRTGNGTWIMKQGNRTVVTSNCDHPESSVVELKNVSHIIREARVEDDTVIGAVELLDTPAGKILQSLVESGVKLGISSRGVGSTRKQGDYLVVEDDYQLICWDIVADPSVPSAFLSEGREVSLSEMKKVFTKSDRIDRVLNDILSLKKA